MNNHRNLLCALLVVSGTAGVACKDIETTNMPPKAVVEVLIDGDAVDTKLPIPYEGSPIEVVLSGKHSVDADGTIAKYQWVRTDIPASVRNGTADGGVAFESDPGNGQTATVMLGEGSYRFTLFVTDDDGAIGTPVSASFSIATIVLFEADPACVATYEGVNADCESCVCAPQAMNGCLDLANNCLDNADPMFSTLCKAVLDCGTANGCLGSACYAPDKCMAEIDTAAGYMGGTLASCQDATMAPEDNPCRAITLFSTCINTAAVPDLDNRAGCGTYCGG
jgi:hypothetical protein